MQLKCTVPLCIKNTIGILRHLGDPGPTFSLFSHQLSSLAILQAIEVGGKEVMKLLVNLTKSFMYTNLQNTFFVLVLEGSCCNSRIRYCIGS